jgi:TonB family protein
VKAYKQAVKLNPELVLAYNNLGTAYHKLGDFKNAVAAYQQAVRLDPRYAQAYYGLGIAYLELKETDRAVEQHKILSQLDPPRADKLYKYIDDQRSLKVLNGQAISKPQPLYPPLAKAQHVSGAVIVWLVVDEKGKVISASAVTGHPLLRPAAIAAAYEARFTPTTVNGQPVKVTGLITYTFALQERPGAGPPPP